MDEVNEVVNEEVTEVVEVAETPTLEVVKTEEITVGCTNCGNSGLACIECSPVFVDTFQ